MDCIFSKLYERQKRCKMCLFSDVIIRQQVSARCYEWIAKCKNRIPVR